MVFHDTIYALSTGQSRSAIAVVRVSGDAARDVLARLTDRDVPKPRELSLRRILDMNGDELDSALIVFFEKGNSFTGENMAEIHCHGSPAVLSELLERLASFDGCRLAEPGEFTWRAVMNGKIDLAEAEGLGDLIAAETSWQRKQALRIKNGELSQSVNSWRERLVRALTLVEIGIDWADEEVPDDAIEEAQRIVLELIEELSGGLKAYSGTARLRTGFQVALVGPPNVGKSTLLNAISGREAAIVSSTPGTTRDVLEIRYNLFGIPVTFLDMAGIREGARGVEAIGIERSRKTADAADLRLHLRSPDTQENVLSVPRGASEVHVASKADLGELPSDVALSATTGEGMDQLLSLVHDRLSKLIDPHGLIGNERHRLAFEEAQKELARSLECSDEALELVAMHLRNACGSLDGIVGRVGVEDVLDSVFSSFCLGK